MHPPIRHIQSISLSLYIYPPTHQTHSNSFNVKIFHLRNTHPPIKHIKSVTLSKFVTLHITTHPQNTVIMSKSFILLPPTHPSDTSKVSHCHCTCTHPPTNSYNAKIFNFRNTHPAIKQSQSMTLSKFVTVHITYKIHIKSFILLTPTHPSDISKVSHCHCTCTHPPTNSYDAKIFNFRNTHTAIEHTQSVTLSKFVTLHKFNHPPTKHSYYVKIIHFITTHPPTHQTYPKCHHVTVHVPTHQQTVMMQKYLILGTPTQPLNIHNVSHCHSTYTHPPIEHT